MASHRSSAVGVRAFAVAVLLGDVLAGCGAQPSASRLAMAPVAKAARPMTTAPAVVERRDEGIVGLADGPLAPRVSVAVGTARTAVATKPADVKASVLTPLQPGQMRVSAATGGMYVSADGTLQAQIPPGALTSDAIVSFTPVDTHQIPSNPGYTPGVRFRADLGGATLNADTQIMVKSLVDDRMVANLKARVGTFDPAAFGLTKDASGRWLMGMPLKGPASASSAVPAAPVTLAERLLAEFGSATAALAAPAASGYALQAVTEDTVGIQYDFAAPTTVEEFERMEDAGLIGCDDVGGCVWSQLMDQSFDAVRFKVDFSQCKAVFKAPVAAPAGAGPGVAAVGEPEMAAPKVITPTTLPARCTWASDDPALDGKPAGGVTVRFGPIAAPGFGAKEIIADAAGRCASFAPIGMQATLTATNTEPLGVSPAVKTIVTPVMAPVELRVPKNSPKIMMMIWAPGSKLPAEVTVRYRMDQQEMLQSFRNPTTENNMNLFVFRVRVPDDAPHQFTVLDVAAQGCGEAQALPKPFPIKRNGVYPLKVTLGNLEPK